MKGRSSNLLPWLLVAALLVVDAWQLHRLTSERAIADRFNVLWSAKADTWLQNSWFGIHTLQNPLDVWVTQEIIWELKPDVIVEAGTYAGGSAAMWASMLMHANPDGRIVTIDIDDQAQDARKLPLVRERVAFLVGSSTAPEIVADVKRRVAGKKVLVILDSNHSEEHVLNELRAYAPMVPVGSYVIVQDGSINGHPVREDYGPGPYEAIQVFLAENGDFVADRERERHLMTSNPMGFLRRVR